MGNPLPFRVLGLVLLLCGSIFAGEGRRMVDAGAPFGELPLVDEVVCGAADDGHEFVEDPKGASRVESLLGRPCRVLPSEGGAKYFAYRMGRGKGLVAGQAYLLTVEFPEDAPRTMFILNRGGEVARGVHTGATLGDVLYTYSDNNCESLSVPLSGAFRTWRLLFWLHDRFPGLKQPRGAGPRPMTPPDGFHAIIAQSSQKNAPRSAGAAVSRIRLFAVPEPERLDLALRLPPEGLPRRHLFWREEMADGVIKSRKPAERGLTDEIDYYEHQARLMRFLGVRTFCKDLLEFGHNQGWDASVHGGNKWYWQSKTPDRWQRILERIEPFGFDVLPYYEWAGSSGQEGVGKMRKCRTLAGGRVYTHIKWSEIMNADITDRETLEDAKRLLDATIIRHKDAASFLGAWFRTRPSHIPISFSDSCLLRFAVEANDRRAVLREDLRADAALLAKYRAWWFGKRRDFFAALRNYLRENGVPEALVFFTPTAAEPGPSLHGFKKCVVTDDVAAWERLLAGPEHAKVDPWPLERAIAAGEHLKAVLSPRPTWGKWEWQHSVPPPDPQRYQDTPGVLLTYPINRAYTVGDADAFDAFRLPSGLAVVRHYPLNENVLEKKLGYFVCDVERAGPYCVLAEARAVAYGDPRFIGTLAAATYNRGFPEAVRRFNAAFLSLPALPSEVLAGAASDDEVIVRAIRTEEHGTWLAVVNVGLRAKDGVRIKLPAAGKVTDAATGEALPARDSALVLDFAPCELRAVHIR
jgi:hypothetical protein